MTKDFVLINLEVYAYSADRGTFEWTDESGRMMFWCQLVNDAWVVQDGWVYRHVVGSVRIDQTVPALDPERRAAVDFVLDLQNREGLIQAQWEASQKANEIAAARRLEEDRKAARARLVRVFDGQPASLVEMIASLSDEAVAEINEAAEVEFGDW